MGEQRLSVEPEPLSWDEICARYPDQYVYLVDMKPPGDPEIASARVLGHAPTYEAAYEPARELAKKYRSNTVRFTGDCTGPLIRPSLVIDDEIRKFLDAPARFYRR